MPEHLDERRKALVAIGLDVEAGIVEEARAGTQADPAANAPEWAVKTRRGGQEML